MSGAKNYKIEQRQVNGQLVSITSYQIGGNWFCHIDNIDPGATIVRVQGDSYEAVIDKAMSRVEHRLE